MDKFFLETIDYLKEGQLRDTGFGSNTSLKRIGLGSKKSEYPTVRNNQISWGSATKTLPPIFPKAQSGTNLYPGGPDAQAKVDLSDLSNSEKQKIIRILYAKINRGVTPTYWRSEERRVGKEC